MKKRIVLTLAILGTVSMLCGFDSAETAESIIQKQQDAIASVSSMDADITINADIDIDFAGAQLSALANGTIDVDLMLDGPALKIDSSIKLTSPLMAQEDQKDYKLYITKNESGAPEIFIYQASSVTGESGWDHNTPSGVNIDTLMSTIPTITPERLSKIDLAFDLAPEAVMVGDTECYKLSAAVESSSFTKLLAEVSEKTGQDFSSSEYYDLILSVLEALKMNVEYYIDTATYLPVQMHLDLNDSTLDIFEQLIETYISSMFEDEANLVIDILLNDASLDMTTAYNTVTEIVIPEEAIAASAAKDSVPDDVEYKMAGAIENLTESSAE